MLAFSVDWFSHNIPIWIEVFDSIGWLDSTARLRVLEVPRDSLLLTVSKIFIDQNAKWLLWGVRLDLGRVGPHVGCCNMFAAALSLR